MASLLQPSEKPEVVIPESWFLRYRIGAAVGVLLVVAGLSVYRSEAPVILHRWSIRYAGILAFFLVGAATFWIYAVRSARARLSRSVLAVDLALLCWGAASLIEALSAPDRAGDLLIGNLVGFEHPVAVVVSWLALAFGLATVLLTSFTVSQKWLFPVLGLLVLAVLAEGGTRVWALANPQTEGYPTHRTRIWMSRYVRLNEWGFRDQSHVGSPPEHRVLLIGDSYGFGWGINRTEDRIGDVLVRKLDSATGQSWQLYNLSRPDAETPDEIAAVKGVPPIHPEAVVLLYVFNDIDYGEIARRAGNLSEAPSTVLQRIDPRRLLFLNSFLYQELYVRLRHLQFILGGSNVGSDVYSDSAVVDRHLDDVCTLLKTAGGEAAVTGLVPFDIAPRLSPRYEARLAGFARQAAARGIPVWRVDSAFAPYQYSELQVNPLDGHANALANHVAAGALFTNVMRSLSSTPRGSQLQCAEHGSVTKGK